MICSTGFDDFSISRFTSSGLITSQPRATISTAPTFGFLANPTSVLSTYL